VLEEELKNKIKQKKIYLNCIIETSKNFIESNKKLIKTYEKMMDESIEKLKIYE